MTFTRLKVITRDYTKNRKSYICLCECGNKKVVQANHLRSGDIRSCGCLLKEWTHKMGKSNVKHEMCNSREYSSWRMMIQRCTNPKSIDWDNYGGRGITVCDRWRNSFEDFYSDMGDRPKGKSIDRINNEGNYEPRNCRWATPKEQANNSRWNV